MAIQVMRTTSDARNASERVLVDGQPLYEKDTNHLYVGDGSTQAKNLTSLNCNNLKDGFENGSLQQSSMIDIEDGSLWNGGSACGFGSIALNPDSKTYEYFSLSKGRKCQAGRSEDEFNAYWWDPVNNVPLHGGKGKDSQGRILSSYGENYTGSRSYACASGHSSKAYGRLSLASGFECTTYGDSSEARGWQTIAEGNRSIAVGYGSKSTGDQSIACGKQSEASGENSISGGQNSIASSSNSIAIGDTCKSQGYCAVAVGQYTKATDTGAVAVGQNTTASGIGSFAGGNSSVASNSSCFAFGDAARASAQGAVAFNIGIASGSESFAVGQSTSSGERSLSAGYHCTAEGRNSIATGNTTSAKGDQAMSIGSESSAVGVNTLAGGYKSKATGESSLAFGQLCESQGKYSMAAGQGAIAYEDAQTVVGTYNAQNDNALLIVGDGWSSNRRNAFAVLKDGRAQVRTVPKDDTDVVRMIDINSVVAKGLEIGEKFYTVSANDKTCTVRYGGETKEITYTYEPDSYASGTLEFDQTMLVTYGMKQVSIPAKLSVKWKLTFTTPQIGAQGIFISRIELKFYLSISDTGRYSSVIQNQQLTNFDTFFSGKELGPILTYDKSTTSTTEYDYGNIGYKDSSLIFLG